MIWWYWLCLGLILIGTEIVTPSGFYLLFFGVASLVVGTLTGVGIVETPWLEWLLFSVLAVVSLLLFRGPLLRMTTRVPTHAVDSMVGESAVLLDDLPPGHTGKAELRGTTWTTRNDGISSIVKGQRAIVMKVDGLMLCVRSE